MPRPSTPLDRVIPVHGATGPTFAQPHAVGAGFAVWTCWDSPSPYPKNDPWRCPSQVWGNAVIWFYLKIGYSQIHWIIIFPKKHGHCGGVPQLKTYTCLLCFCFSRNPAALILPIEVLDLLEGDLLIPIFHVLRQGASVPAVGLLNSFQGRVWTLDTLISEVL